MNPFTTRSNRMDFVALVGNVFYNSGYDGQVQALLEEAKTWEHFSDNELLHFKVHEEEEMQGSVYDILFILPPFLQQFAERSQQAGEKEAELVWTRFQLEKGLCSARAVVEALDAWNDAKQLVEESRERFTS